MYPVKYYAILYETCRFILDFYFLVCIVGDVVYGIDEEIPSEQPCLKCKCQPPGVHCETTRCVKKPGCRAIHKPNQCCPDYQCGKYFLNIIIFNL